MSKSGSSPSSSKSKSSSSSVIEKQLQYQLQIRNAAEDYKNALNDLYSWEAEIKQKEKQITAEVNVNQPEELIRSAKYEQENQQTSTTKTIIHNSTSASANTATDSNSDDLKTEADLLKDKGNFHVKLGEYEKAISYYTDAIKRLRTNPIYYANRALCFLKLERYDRCIKDCNRAIRLDEKYSKAFYRRMQAYECLGDDDKAFKDCKIILDIEPNNSEAISSFERLKKKLGIKEFREILKSGSFKQISAFDSLPKDVIQIETVSKPSHLRSKLPLVRVPISDEIDGVSPLQEVSAKTNKNVENSTIASSNQQDIQQQSEESKKQKTKDPDISSSSSAQAKYPSTSVDILQKDGSKIDVFNMKPPKSSAEFYSTWKELSEYQKYLYLKSIDPTIIHLVLGAGLTPAILSEIISILSIYYVENNDNIGDILFNLSNHFEMPILSHFLSEKNKNELSKLVNYLEEQNYDAQYMDQIKTVFCI